MALRQKPLPALTLGPSANQTLRGLQPLQPLCKPYCPFGSTRPDPKDPTSSRLPRCTHFVGTRYPVPHCSIQTPKCSYFLLPLGRPSFVPSKVECVYPPHYLGSCSSPFPSSPSRPTVFAPFQVGSPRWWWGKGLASISPTSPYPP